MAMPAEEVLASHMEKSQESLSHGGLGPLAHEPMRQIQDRVSCLLGSELLRSLGVVSPRDPVLKNQEIHPPLKKESLPAPGLGRCRTDGHNSKGPVL